MQDIAQNNHIIADLFMFLVYSIILTILFGIWIRTIFFNQTMVITPISPKKQKIYQNHIKQMGQASHIGNNNSDEYDSKSANRRAFSTNFVLKSPSMIGCASPYSIPHYNHHHHHHQNPLTVMLSPRVSSPIMPSSRQQSPAPACAHTITALTIPALLDASSQSPSPPPPCSTVMTCASSSSSSAAAALSSSMSDGDGLSPISPFNQLPMALSHPFKFSNSHNNNNALTVPSPRSPMHTNKQNHQTVQTRNDTLHVGDELFTDSSFVSVSRKANHINPNGTMAVGGEKHQVLQSQSIDLNRITIHNTKYNNCGHRVHSNSNEKIAKNQQKKDVQLEPCLKVFGTAAIFFAVLYSYLTVIELFFVINWSVPRGSDGGASDFTNSCSIWPASLTPMFFNRLSIYLYLLYRIYFVFKSSIYELSKKVVTLFTFVIIFAFISMYSFFTIYVTFHECSQHSIDVALAPSRCFDLGASTLLILMFIFKLKKLVNKSKINANPTNVLFIRKVQYLINKLLILLVVAVAGAVFAYFVYHFVENCKLQSILRFDLILNTVCLELSLTAFDDLYQFTFFPCRLVCEFSKNNNKLNIIPEMKQPTHFF